MHIPYKELPATDVICSTLKELNVVKSSEREPYIILDKFNSGYELALIHNLGKSIEFEDKPGKEDLLAFEPKLDSNGVITRAIPTKLGNQLRSLEKVPTQETGIHIVSEYIRSMMYGFREAGFLSFGDINVRQAENDWSYAETINNIFERIRERFKSDSTQDRIRAIYRNSYKNYCGMRDYVNSMFDQYSKLCVVRLDLTYKYEGSRSVSLQRAVNDHKAFMSSKRRHPLFKNLVGFISKMHYGEEKGYHYHLALFFNGSKVIKGEYVGMKLGQYWRDEITSGAGTYYCSNSDKKDLKKKGIWAVGLVRHDDEGKRQKLDKAMRYMTSSDQYVLAKIGKHDKIYQRGVLRHVGKKITGRPRSSKAVSIKNKLKMSETREFKCRMRKEEWKRHLAKRHKDMKRRTNLLLEYAF